MRRNTFGSTVRDAGLTVTRLDAVVLRKEMDEPVQGLLVAATRG